MQWLCQINIVRGKTDPGYWVHNLSKSFNLNTLKLISVKLLELVANLATRWRHLHWLPILPPDASLAYWFQIWPPDGANCISCKFAHQMAPLALVPYLTTRWHHLHWLQTWPPDGTTWISYKFGHQMSPLVLVPNLTTRWLFTNLTIRWVSTCLEMRCCGGGALFSDKIFGQYEWQGWAFGNVGEVNDFDDVTLAFEDIHQVDAHKVILAGQVLFNWFNIFYEHYRHQNEYSFLNSCVNRLPFGVADD